MTRQQSSCCAFNEVLRRQHHDDCSHVVNIDRGVREEQLVGVSLHWTAFETGGEKWAKWPHRIDKGSSVSDQLIFLNEAGSCSVLTTH